MKRVYLHFAEQRRQVIVGDLKIVAMERFDLAKNAVDEAWKTVDKTIKVKRGNSKTAAKVSIKEIRELK